MRKTIYILYMIFGTVTFLATIQGLFQEDMTLAGLGMYCTVSCLLVALIAEPRSRDTDENKKHDEKTQTAGSIMLLIVTVVAAMLVLSSCSTSGYGCHGRSKCMTRVR